jgi:organic hydroperoxide reductase OsmC/OhrA
VIKRIRLRYHLRDCPADKQDAAKRAHDHHHAKCPVYRSIGGCIDITTALEFI